MRSIRRAAIAFFALVALPLPLAAAEEITPIKIVGMFGLTGTIATFGIADQRGVELGTQYVNETGGVNGRKLEAEFIDFASDKAQIAVQFRRLVGRDDVYAMIGPAWTAGLLGISGLIDSSGLPVMEPGSKAPWKGSFPKYLFRDTLVIPNAIPAALAEMHRRQPFQSLGVIYDSANEYQSFERDAALKAAKDLGVRVTTVEAVRTGDTDYSAVLTKIGQDPPDLLVVSAYANEAGSIIQQARQRGIKSQIFGGIGIADENVYHLSGGAAEGATTVSSYNPDDPRPLVQEFKRRYAAKYGGPPDENNALAFDAVLILREAMKSASPLTRQSLTEAIGRLKDIEGVNGRYSYSGNGDTASPPYILGRYESGRLIWVK